MVVLEEAVVQMSISLHSVLNLIKALWNIAFRVKVFGSNLGNVEVNQVAVVTVQFKELVALKTGSIDIVLNVNMLVR